jgi:hypothetical protein
MKLRTSLAAAGAAAVLGAAGAFLPTAMASAHSTTQTLRFTSVQGPVVNYTKAQAQQDTDVNAAGKTVGFNELYGTATSSTTAAVTAAVDAKGGFLYGTYDINFSTGVITNGEITGGTGAFAGAKGTLTAKAVNKSGTKYAVVITYSG